MVGPGRGSDAPGTPRDGSKAPLAMRGFASMHERGRERT